MADETAQPNKQILLQKIYIKDLSFESPKVPEIFGANIQASTQLNIGAKNRKIGDDTVEVTLTLTIESKDNTQTLFLIEVAQAGSIGRALCPLSPPTITQLIAAGPRTPERSSGPSSGSQDRNRTAVGRDATMPARVM